MTLFEGSLLAHCKQAQFCRYIVCRRNKGTSCHMRGVATSLPLVTKFRPIFSPEARLVGTMTPKKQVNDDAGEARIEKESAEPIAAFSRPPPLPSFLGPLFALSMLESWTKHDGNDD